MQSDLQNLRNLSDEVDHLESDYSKVSAKVVEIDNVLLNMKENMMEEKKIDRKYERRGYCKEKENCPFYHTNEVCETYVELGVCYKETCKLRHPKPCRYQDK